MPPALARPGELSVYREQAKAHGRLEQRTLECSIALNAYLDWPGLAQVLRRTYRRVLLLGSGVVQTETTYGITSLSRKLAGPEPLECFWHGHWTIENRLHLHTVYFPDVRDVTFSEDRTQVHLGSAPQALAALRNGVLSFLRYHGWSNTAEATAATRRIRSARCGYWAVSQLETTLFLHSD